MNTTPGLVGLRPGPDPDGPHEFLPLTGSARCVTCFSTSTHPLHSTGGQT